jgi:diguanylate cyclase (GGDEF)-like protein
MKGIARRSGDYVARYGGEEFVVILPVTGKKSAIYIAEKIRQTLEKRAIAHSKSSVAPFVTLSLGVATVVPNDKGTPELLIKCADDALYLAKSSGRNRVMVWEPPKETPPQD